MRESAHASRTGHRGPSLRPIAAGHSISASRGEWEENSGSLSPAVPHRLFFRGAAWFARQTMKNGRLRLSQLPFGIFPGRYLRTFETRLRPSRSHSWEDFQTRPSNFGKASKAVCIKHGGSETSGYSKPPPTREFLLSGNSRRLAARPLVGSCWLPKRGLRHPTICQVPSHLHKH